MLCDWKARWTKAVRVLFSTHFSVGMLGLKKSWGKMLQTFLVFQGGAISQNS